MRWMWGLLPVLKGILLWLLCSSSGWRCQWVLFIASKNNEETDFPDPDTGNTIDGLMARASMYERGASEHRLNLPTSKQNQSLQRASAVNAKVAALRKQKLSEVIKISTSLFIFEEKGKAAKKVCLYYQNLSHAYVFEVTSTSNCSELCLYNDCQWSVECCQVSCRTGIPTVDVILNFVTTQLYKVCLNTLNL